jgi:hypothetical protein
VHGVGDSRLVDLYVLPHGPPLPFAQQNHRCSGGTAKGLLAAGNVVPLHLGAAQGAASLRVFCRNEHIDDGRGHGFVKEAAVIGGQVRRPLSTHLEEELFGRCTLEADEGVGRWVPPLFALVIMLHCARRGESTPPTLAFPFDGEWRLVVLRAAAIRMRNERVPDVVADHASPDGMAFTIRELASAVEETERRARGSTAWFGGVDVHHVFFEGIHLDDAGTWNIRWGS